jgi:hypothetical protein
MIWQDLEAEAPEIARLGKERLDRTRVALLGTLRSDGSPRISPIEPYFVEGHLIFGSMARSLKTLDLQRDSRCVLHSAICDPDSGEGELKLSGRAIQASDQIRQACRQGWWTGRSLKIAAVFSLDIAAATFISWDIEHGEMIVRRWRPRSGVTVDRHSYP